jgi:CheY-like chemotaxis protein
MARVLIVQADEQLRADVVADLRAEGHEVLEAASADRGVEAARDADPEIILLDPMLPDRSGYEVYATLQRDPDTVTIPVLFLPGKRRAGQGQPLAGGIDLVTRLGWRCGPRACTTSSASATPGYGRRCSATPSPGWPTGAPPRSACGW